MYDKQPNVVSLPRELTVDYSLILSKPFLITTTNWTTSSSNELIRIRLPSAFINNPLVSIPFSSTCFYRCQMSIMVQISGTPQHQGCLIAAAIPVGTPSIQSLNQLLMAPHVFLNANEQTSVSLEIPFYQNTSVIHTSNLAANPIVNDNYPYNSIDFADFIIYVVNPLIPSSSASTSLSAALYAKFDNMDFYVPNVPTLTWNSSTFNQAQSFQSFTEIPSKAIDAVASYSKKAFGDVIDSARSIVRSETGFHNPEHPTQIATTKIAFRTFPNNVDTSVNSEKLDLFSHHNRIHSDFYFMTSHDEMLVQHLVSKPVYLGTFKVTSSNTTGTPLFSRPITPYVELSTNDVVAPFYSNMRLLYETTSKWKGKLRIHIQSVMTNFHFCKLIVVRNYNPDKKMMTLANPNFPTFSQIHNLMTDTLEFSGGGQIQSVDLPYCAVTEWLDNVKDPTILPVLHGMFYIYLVQPLVVGVSSPQNVSFNVYISGTEETQFAGPSIDPIIQVPPSGPTYSTVNLSIDNKPSFFSEKLQTYLSDPDLSQYTFAQSHTETMAPTSDQSDITDNINDFQKPSLSAACFMPIVSIRDILRRYNMVGRIKANPTSYNFQYSILISDLLYNPNSSYISLPTPSPLSLWSNMYQGLTGGIRFKIRVTGAAVAQLKFIPPNEACALDTSVSSSYQAEIVATAPVYNSSRPAVSNELVRQEAFYDPEDGDYATQGCFIELPDYIRPVALPAASSFSLSAMNAFEFEFYVPNYNKRNFVGSMARYSDQYRQYDIEHPTLSLGSLLLTGISSNYAESQYQTLDVVIYASLADESRLGMQVYSPPKIIPAVTDDNRCRLTAQNYIVPTGFDNQTAPYILADVVWGSFYTAT